MGRGNLCGATGAIPRGLADVSVLVQTNPTARTAAAVVVQVKGCRFAAGKYLNLIEEVVVEETCGQLMPMATVRLANPELAITNDDVWEEGAEVSIETGFPTTGMVGRGKFILSSPRFLFKGKPEILLVCFGEEMRLGQTEKRRAFKKKRDSEIAQEIASEHGFEAEIESTPLVHEQVIQANESDYKFLCRRALLHGFMVFVRDGVLHFHKPRPEETSTRLVYREGQDSTLSSFDVRSKTFLRGAEWKVTAVDPLKLEVIDEHSNDDLDEATKKLIADTRNPRKWSEIVETEAGGRPMRFAVNHGHEQQLGQLKEQVQAYDEASRWVVQGKGTVFGLEQLKPNQVIELLGLGRHSGRYYLTKVTHRIRGGVYGIDFDVVRSFTGGTEGNRCQEQAVEPVRAGVVDLS